MDDWKLPWTGGCRCGAVRVRVTAPPMLSSACHCTGCQRMTGSAFALSLTFHEEGFAVTRGEPVLGGAGTEPKHYHCPACKSWMFTRPSDPAWLVNLRATMLDEPGWVRPFVEFYRDEGFGWARTGAAHSFASVPAPEEFGRLIQQHADAGARP